MAAWAGPTTGCPCGWEEADWAARVGCSGAATAARGAGESHPVAEPAGVPRLAGVALAHGSAEAAAEPFLLVVAKAEDQSLRPVAAGRPVGRSWVAPRGAKRERREDHPMAVIESRSDRTDS